MSDESTPAKPRDPAAFVGALAHLEPSKVKRVGVKQDPQFSPHEVNAIYASRQRKVSWKDIHAALAAKGLVTDYTRASTLAQVVHECARRHNIEPFITVERKPKAPAAA